MKYALDKVTRFTVEEDAVAMTEYLLLLGILIGGVLVAMTTVGGNLSGAWTSWSTWWTSTAPTP